MQPNAISNQKYEKSEKLDEKKQPALLSAQFAVHLRTVEIAFCVCAHGTVIFLIIIIKSVTELSRMAMQRGAHVSPKKK